MLKNYFKIALRNLIKHRGYSLINITGLAIGMTCCVLIVLFVRDELSYDRFFPDHDRIHRLWAEITMPGQPIKDMAVTATPMAPALEAAIPEIEAATRLMAYFEAALPGRAAVSYQQNEFYDRFFWADNRFFEVFGHEVLAGDPETALMAPFKVILTEETALRYFGDADPMGKVLTIDSGFSQVDYEVSAVVSNYPGKSHANWDILASFDSLTHETDERVDLNLWVDFDSYTYLKLAPGADPRVAESKMPDVLSNYVSERAMKMFNLNLIPLTDVHLHSQMLNELEPNSDMAYIYLFSAVACIILLVACINFMNLSTARSANRAREVGMRKVMGAYREHLIYQFLGESLLLAGVAMVFAIFLVRLVLPSFNDLVGKDLTFGGDVSSWLVLFAVTLIAGLLAGCYPAFFLSSFRPIQVLGGTLAAGGRSGLFRKVLVVFQFTVSVILIIGTCVIWDQLRYMQRSDLGISMDRVLVVPVRDSTLKDRYLTAKSRIEQVPNVESTALSALMMGKEAPDLGTFAPGSDEPKLLGSLIVDQDWADFYGLKLIAGRKFLKENGDADLEAFMLTESGMKELGYQTPEEALGKHLYWSSGIRDGYVIGIVEDFHYQPLRFPIKPVIMLLRPIAYHFMAIKLGGGDLQQTIDDLQPVWAEVFPGRPFSWSLLQDEFDRMYRSDVRLGQAIATFSLVAVFLGCLGLLGLASFTAEQRTKEIGVRKALGATVPSVIVLLSKELSYLIAISVLIAWPIAFMVLRNWLDRFAYRTDLNLGYFLLGGAMALLVASLTVGYQSLRAALTNPSDALRYE